MRVITLYSVVSGELRADYPFVECEPRNKLHLGSHAKNRIYDLFAQGVLTIAEIAELFDLPQQTIRSIGLRSLLAIRRWKALNGKA